MDSNTTPPLFFRSVEKELAAQVLDYSEKLKIAIEALKQCKVYSECYEELIETIDRALVKLSEKEEKKAKFIGHYEPDNEREKECMRLTNIEVSLASIEGFLKGMTEGLNMRLEAIEKRL